MLEPNSIFCGDCKDVLKKFPEGFVDLIYLDPPFSSDRNYVGFWQKTKEELAFDDVWEHGVKGYIEWLTPRIKECFRVLKSTGSIYVHCDWHANAYIRVMMDGVAKDFGGKFRNEIVWCYRGGGVPKKDFAKKHDTIFRYSKTKNRCFNVDAVRIPYSIDSKERLQYKARAFRKDKIYDTYEQNPEGKHPEDWWTIQPIMPSSKERLGYPTQKPEALLERIIKASSNEGDIVLDPYCGCGTTLAVAAQLKRRFIGIDIYRQACKVMDNRLKDLRNDTQRAVPYFEWKLIIPSGISDIKNYDWRNFQDWVCEKLGSWKGKRGADGGIDGKTYHDSNIIYDTIRKKLISLPADTLIQSKHYKSGPVGVPHLKKFESSIRAENKTEGIVVSWGFAKTAGEHIMNVESRGIKLYLVEADWLFKQPTTEGPYTKAYNIDIQQRLK